MKQKNLLIAICLLLLLASPTLAHEADTSSGVVTISGFSVGYVVEGAGEKSVTNDIFGGVRVKKFSESTSGYVVAHKYGSDEGIGGVGGKGILAVKMKGVPDVSLLIGAGFVDKIAKNADSSMVAGVTIEGGFAWNAAENVNIGLYGFGADRGENYAYSLHAFVTLVDPVKLIMEIF